MKSENIPAEPCSESDEEPVITVPTFSNWYEYASLRLDNKIWRKVWWVADYNNTKSIKKSTRAMSSSSWHALSSLGIF